MSFYERPPDDGPRRPKKPKDFGRFGSGRAIRHFRRSSVHEVPLIRERTPRRSDASQSSQSAADYIPLLIFVPISLLTFGIYPYIWFLRRIDSFAAIGTGELDRNRAVAYCIIGSAACAMLSAGLAAWSFAQWHHLALAGALLLVLAVVPMRTFWLFELRRRLRDVAHEWDQGAMMTYRTLPSPTLLFIFGSFYLQLHINRLIGLGMPDLGDYDDVAAWEDASLREVLTDFLYREDDKGR